MKIAAGGGSPLGKLLFCRDREISLRLMYLESRYMIYRMTYLDTVFSRLFRLRGGAKKGKEQQKIRIMVEATTCTASYVPEEVFLEEREVPEEDIQPTYYDDERLRTCGSVMAKRLVRRHLGRNLSIQVDREEKVFRPFYIAFYGEVKEGNKVRYLPIEADGNTVQRTF